MTVKEFREFIKDLDRNVIVKPMLNTQPALFELVVNGFTYYKNVTINIMEYKYRGEHWSGRYKEYFVKDFRAFLDGLPDDVEVSVFGGYFDYELDKLSYRDGIVYLYLKEVPCEEVEEDPRYL